MKNIFIVVNLVYFKVKSYRVGGCRGGGGRGYENVFFIFFIIRSVFDWWF